MPSRLLRLLRGLLGPCLVLGLTSAASCANKPLAPAPTEPATGSEWVEPPAPTPTVAAQPEPQGPLLLATDVDGRHDALIDGERVRAEYGPGDPWMGAEFPTVTMVVYFDYQCPYSRKLMTTLNELVGIYPRDVRVVFKHFPLPFHPQARPAAIASVAAMRQGRFWVMHDALFSEPKSLGPDTIRTHALRLALDIELFEAAIGDPDVGAFVDAEIARGQQLGVRGTPNTFINGRKVTGAQALASLRTEIDAELEVAARLLDEGAPRSALYAHFMHAAKPPAGPTDPTDPPRVAAGTRSIEQPRVEVDTTGLPGRGPSNPRVTIVGCADFDCPFCGRVGPTLDELLANHPDDVALFFQHMPLAFHTNAEPAARAAVAAQAQGKFWVMHDLLFDNRKMRTDKQLEKLAKKAGLNVNKWRKAFRSSKTAATVQSQSESCTALGVRGTPGFLINGRSLGGAQPLAAFEAIVAEELQQAQ